MSQPMSTERLIARERIAQLEAEIAALRGGGMIGRLKTAILRNQLPKDHPDYLAPRADREQKYLAELEAENAELRKDKERLAAVRNLLAEGLFVYMPCVSGPGKDVDEEATILLLEQAMGDMEAKCD